MGKYFGNLARISRIIYFQLSPNEQRPFGGFIKYGFPNTLRRLRLGLAECGPFVLYFYIVTHWADELHEEFSRKPPTPIDPNDPAPTPQAQLVIEATKSA